MGCRDCGKKVSRYGAKPPITHVDGPQGITMSINDVPPDERNYPLSMSPPDPYQAFVSAKSQSYEELKEVRDFRWRMMVNQQDQLRREMSPAMRRIHVEDLIISANSEAWGVPGVTPSQAVVMLQELLELEEFLFVEELYPGLKSKVNARFASIQNDSLPGPKNK